MSRTIENQHVELMSLWRSAFVNGQQQILDFMNATVRWFSLTCFHFHRHYIKPCTCMTRPHSHFIDSLYCAVWPWQWHYYTAAVLLLQNSFTLQHAASQECPIYIHHQLFRGSIKCWRWPDFADTFSQTFQLQTIQVSQTLKYLNLVHFSLQEAPFRLQFRQTFEIS